MASPQQFGPLHKEKQFPPRAICRVRTYAVVSKSLAVDNGVFYVFGVELSHLGYAGWSVLLLVQ